MSALSSFSSQKDTQSLLPPLETKGKKPLFAVAMSGGVDSAVAALLLARAGYSLVGLHLKLHGETKTHKKACCSLDDSLDARGVCDKLGIPYYVLDFQARFKAQVIQYFVESYNQGKTPNPCVECNRTVKMSELWEKAKKIGCTHLATGHYASLRHVQGQAQLCRPKEQRKDQTYFLQGIQASLLPHLYFPLAGLTKEEVRDLAEEFGTRMASKTESQEVCFVPKNYRGFLQEKTAPSHRPFGEMVDTEGKVLGQHKGLDFYTVGQRKGLEVKASHQPYYVLRLDKEQNKLVLGSKEQLYHKEMQVKRMNWLAAFPPEKPFWAEVQVRYAHAPQKALVEPEAKNWAKVMFAEPVKAITPGQFAAIYAGEVLLGGGIIHASLA